MHPPHPPTGMKESSTRSPSLSFMRARLKSHASAPQPRTHFLVPYTPLLVVGVVASVIVVLGAVSLFSDIPPNSCLNRPEHPVYFEISLQRSPLSTSPSVYRLLRVVEDKKLARSVSTAPSGLAFPLSSLAPPLVGVPVVFVPGHAGSFSQVKSLVSHVSMQHHTNGGPHFDFFAVDFLERWSAFHGSVLTEQTDFVNDCIATILALYRQSQMSSHTRHGSSPRSVLLIGHSMGGIVARATMTRPNYTPGSVRTVLTLGTPHRSSPWPTDRSLSLFYEHVNTLWLEAGEEVNEAVLVSITGGIRDTVVFSDICDISDVASPKRSLFVFTTGIPGVRTSVDHLCLMWCGQLMDVLASLLAQWVDPTSNEFIESADQRMEVARQVLLSPLPSVFGLEHTSIPFREKDLSQSFNATAAPPVIWVDGPMLRLESISAAASFEMIPSSLESFFLITSLPPGSIVVSLRGSTSPIREYDWFPGLDSPLAPQRSLVKGEGLRVLCLQPSYLKSVKAIRLDIPMRNDRAFLLAQLFEMPVIPFVWPVNLGAERVVLPAGHATMQRLSLSTLRDRNYAHVLRHEENCRGPVSEPLFPAITYVRGGISNEEFLSLASHVDMRFSQSSPHGVEAILLSDPACDSSVILTFAFRRSMGLFLRSFGIMIFPAAFVLLLCVLGIQIFTLCREGSMPSPLSVLRAHIWVFVIAAIATSVPYLLHPGAATWDSFFHSIRPMQRDDAALHGPLPPPWFLPAGVIFVTVGLTGLLMMCMRGVMEVSELLYCSLWKQLEYSPNSNLVTPQRESGGPPTILSRLRLLGIVVMLVVTLLHPYAVLLIIIARVALSGVRLRRLSTPREDFVAEEELVETGQAHCVVRMEIGRRNRLRQAMEFTPVSDDDDSHRSPSPVCDPQDSHVNYRHTLLCLYFVVLIYTGTCTLASFEGWPSTHHPIDLHTFLALPIIGHLLVARKVLPPKRTVVCIALLLCALSMVIFAFHLTYLCMYAVSMAALCLLVAHIHADKV